MTVSLSINLAFADHSDFATNLKNPNSSIASASASASASQAKTCNAKRIKCLKKAKKSAGKRVCLAKYDSCKKVITTAIKIKNKVLKKLSAKKSRSVASKSSRGAGVGAGSGLKLNEHLEHLMQSK